VTILTFTTSGSWTAPAGVYFVDCQAWGEGGNAVNTSGGTARVMPPPPVSLASLQLTAARALNAELQARRIQGGG